MKKAWQKPQLVVLTRSKPEEAVLTACKVWTSGPPGPTNNDNYCLVLEFEEMCGRCDATPIS